MKTITKEQIIKISTLITKLCLSEYKDEIIMNVSNGRTKSRKELFFDEAKSLIIYLEDEFSSVQKMIRKIFAIGYQIEMFYGDSPEDKKINNHVLNQFLKRRGVVKKEIFKMNKKEVHQTVNQFENMKTKMEKSDIKKMLSELQITVQ